VGLIKAIAGRRLYLDSNIFIYAVEQHPVFSFAVKQIFESIDQGRSEAVTSEFRHLENIE